MLTNVNRTLAQDLHLVCLPPKTPRRKLAATIEGIPTPSKKLLMQDVATEEVSELP